MYNVYVCIIYIYNLGMISGWYIKKKIGENELVAGWLVVSPPTFLFSISLSYYIYKSKK